MLSWLRQSAWGVSVFAAAIAVLTGMAMLQGCALDEWIEAKVPRKIQKAISVRPKVPLRDAEITYEEWEDHVRRESNKFARNIADAQFIYDFATSVIDTGIVFSEGPLQNLPGGGMIIGGLSLLGGLFMRKPGTQKQITQLQEKAMTEMIQFKENSLKELQKEKESSFKAGERSVMSTLAAANGTDHAALTPEDKSPTGGG